MEKGIVSTKDTAEAVGVETKETSPETLDTAFEEAPAKAEEAEAAEKPTIDWTGYGLPNLDGKDPEFVKNFFSFTNKKYGQQANELGELRKYKEDKEKLIEQITGEKPPEKSEEMSDLELAKFAEAFNENPRRAMEEFLMPKITESLESKLFEKLKEKFEPVMAEKAENLTTKQEYASFVKDHPDHEKYSDAMYELMTDAYLGENAAFEETYKLAVLAEEEASLFPEACKLMRAGIPFEEAREYASLKQNAPANTEAKKEQVKKEIAKIAGGKKHAATKQGDTEPEIKTMDEAFAPD